ncbi:hypothetical protein GG344DRAFT_66849 [Lentinula edodes]|nr:hypothetical protein GG344DRAFT_66849 [Lentinula edodes]
MRTKRWDTGRRLRSFDRIIIIVVVNEDSTSYCALGMQFGVGRFLSWMRGDRLFVGSSASLISLNSRSTDYHRGHLAVLSVLTVVSDSGQSIWLAQFHFMRASSKTYYPIVIVSKQTDQIVALGCVFIEPKFLRGLGNVGHIEDTAVHKRQQGKKLELRIIQMLT